MYEREHLPETIGRYNAALYRNLRAIRAEKLRDVAVDSGQHDYLYVIAACEGLTQKELSEILLVDKSTTARAIKALLERGCIYRKQDEADRRLERIYLSPKGRAMEGKIKETFAEMVELTKAALTEEEAETLLALLKKTTQYIAATKTVP